MDVTETLNKKIIETGYLLAGLADPGIGGRGHRAILENQVQIMRGLRALLKGGFEPYDDEGEQEI